MNEHDQNPQKKRAKAKGFSLLELTVAIFLAAFLMIILASIGMNQYWFYLRYRASQVQDDILKQILNTSRRDYDASIDEPENTFLRNCTQGYIDGVDPLTNSGRHCVSWTYYDLRLTHTLNSPNDAYTGTSAHPLYLNFDGYPCVLASKNPDVPGSNCYLKVTAQFRVQCPLIPGQDPLAPSFTCSSSFNYKIPTFLEVKYSIEPILSNQAHQLMFLNIKTRPLKGSIFVAL